MRTPDYVLTDAPTPGYLTTGERYPLFNFEEDDGGYVFDDDGGEIFILLSECAHLQGMSWKKGYIFHV